MDRPAPLVPPEVDLTGYEFMPYYGDRLRNSDMNGRATDAEYRAAHNLWWSSWKQIPASSLPADDVILCKLADLGRDQKTWTQVKERALHGFVLCSDGRYYHRILSMLALDAWDARVTASAKGKAGASKRWAKHGQKKNMPQPDLLNGTGNATVTENDSKREERKGKERKEEVKTKASAARQPDVLKPADVAEQVWSDFVAHRKAKRAPLTDTALKGIRTQADVAGMTLEAALRTCCERGWQGFMAEWVVPKGRNGQSTNRSSEVERRNHEAVQEALRLAGEESNASH